MPYSSESEPEPRREEVDGMAGPVVLEFGAAWCPHCQALQGELAGALDARPDVRHIKIEDGKGKPLGRSFRVKLWPTLVFMRDGQVLKQVSRPSSEELENGMGLLGEA
ncbi:MAG TPA: thioredoxin family protein [Pirellulales bacterium]|nr:thioredoxin family protein [Pirellulales bacterium]